MTTKTIDSTVSQLLQDDSSVEYVDPKENPICKKQSDNSLFNFHAEHNGEACIESLRPEDRGTENHFRFTAALLVKHWKTTFKAFQMTGNSVRRISAVLKKYQLLTGNFMRRTWRNIENMKRICV